MADIIIHPTTEQEIRHFLERPAHALVLIGPSGIGKSSLSRYIVAGLLQMDVESLDKYPYLSVVSSLDGKALSIDTIRELQRFMTLKIPRGKTSINRIAIVEDAHLLTTEAQNALLKTLEEPPEGTTIIMAASSAEALLPTILSRTRSLHVTLPSEKELTDHFEAAGHASSDITRVLMLSGGLPGLAHALLTDPQSHPLFEATEIARKVLQASAYDRLALVDSMSKQKELCQNVLFILGQMARTALQKADTMPLKNRQKWQTILRESYVSSERLRRNAQAKLVLTDLMLNI